MYSSFVTQARSSTRSRCMAPASAIGPPKPRVPRRRKYATNALRLTSAAAMKLRHQLLDVTADGRPRAFEIFADLRHVVPAFAVVIAVDADHSRRSRGIRIVDVLWLELAYIEAVALQEFDDWRRHRLIRLFRRGGDSCVWQRELLRQAIEVRHRDHTLRSAVLT